MASRKLLKGRCSLPNYAYHLTFCTQNKQTVFNDFHCARLLVNELKIITEQGKVNTLAWVVMPDHLHWLVQLQSESKLKNITQAVKGKSALVINRNLNRQGQLWQRGYHDHAIRDEKQFIGTARYIVANPLRARLVNKIGDYPHWDAIWL